MACGKGGGARSLIAMVREVDKAWDCQALPGSLHSWGSWRHSQLLTAAHLGPRGRRILSVSLLAGQKFPGSQSLNLQQQFLFLLVGNQPFLGD